MRRPPVALQCRMQGNRSRVVAATRSFGPVPGVTAAALSPSDRHLWRQIISAL